MLAFHSIARLLAPFASRRPRAGARPARRSPARVVEPLEARRLLAATVTIGSTADVAEGDEVTVTFTVTDPAVFQGPTTTYTVGCRIEGSATVHADYEGPKWRSTEVTITQGSAVGTRTVTVPVLPDNLVEGQETLIFVLDTSIGGGTGWAPAQPSTATTRVADDPPRVSIRREYDGYETPNNASPMGFFLNRVGGNLAEPLDVYVEPAGGTATAGEDYVTPTGPVQFAANQTGKALSVAVIDDPWHEPMESLALAVRNLMLGSAAAAYVSSDDLLAVHSVEWDGVAASDGATNFEADPYENMGDGFRLFPEKNKPPSIDEHAPLHDRAKVVVTLNGKVAPGETVPVYCKLFDVDDPTAFMDAVDSNDLPGHRVEDRAYMGDDNRPPGVGPGNPSIVLGAGQDVAWFEYSFARCQPGDNFRAFATTDQALFNEVQLDVYVENGDSRVNPFRRGLDRANKPPGKYASKTLAIWRKFHVELDSMAAPGAGEVFDAQNDDVNPGGPARKPDISLAKANFRPAFIEVVDDLAAWDITDGVTWDRNVEDAELVVFPGQGVLQEKRDVIGDAGFWAMPLVGGYELSEGKDNDPANERPTWLGVTAHGVGSFIALETIRDMAESGFIGYKPKETIEQRTVVHELAHHFRGIRHGDPSGAGDEGPLSNTNNLRGTDAQNQFTDRQLALLRSDENPCDDR